MPPGTPLVRLILYLPAVPHVLCLGPPAQRPFQSLVIDFKIRLKTRLKSGEKIREQQPGRERNGRTAAVERCGLFGLVPFAFTRRPSLVLQSPFDLEQEKKRSVFK